MTLLSVIVPIYNVEEYLPKCLESIIFQTFQDFELILINDGSKDNSGSICEEYKKRDNRIRVIHQRNAGVSNARNKGLKNSTGKYVAFVDPDDTLEPNMYEILLMTALKTKGDMVVCPIKTINLVTHQQNVSSIYDKPGTLIYHDEIIEKLLPSILNNKTLSLVSSVNKLYKREVFEKKNIQFEERKNHSEDFRLNFKIIQSINSLVYVEPPLYNYFIRNNESLTHIFREDLYEYIEDNRSLLIEACIKYNYPKYIKKVRNHYAGVTLSYLNELASRPINKAKKHLLVNSIIKDKEFLEDLREYNAPSIYMTLLTFFCKLKRVGLVNKLILLKNRVDKFRFKSTY